MNESGWLAGWASSSRQRPVLSDVSKAVRAPIGAAMGDAITDSQAEAVKRLVPFQSYVGMRKALDLLTAGG